MEVEDGASRSVVGYALDDSVFEVEFDWSEMAVFLLVCQPGPSGGRPGGYYRDRGQLVRVHLLEALGRAGLADDGLRSALRAVTRRSGASAMEAQIALAANTLAEVLAALRDRYGSVFDSG